MIRGVEVKYKTNIYVEDLEDDITKEFCAKVSLKYNIIKVRVGKVTLENIYKKQDLEQLLKAKNRFMFSSHNPNYISKALIISEVKDISAFVWGEV